MTTRQLLNILLTVTFLCFCDAVHAGIITFSDSDLASSNPVTISGVTLTTSTGGGSIAFWNSGAPWTGLWLGDDHSSGSYTLGFSQPINSIEIEFDALSNTGPTAAEQLFNFANSNGAVSIAYTNQGGTLFDGTVITSTADNGEGIISFAGPAFNSFSFDHGQGEQTGFIVERLVINAVPEPSTLAALAGLLGMGMIGYGWRRRRKR
ncbi:PEP-CTERM sorting domain-containing protein [Planctomycetota bacterium]